MNPQDSRPGGAAAPAEGLKNAAIALSRASDNARYGMGPPPDYDAIDGMLGQALGHLLDTRKVDLIRSLGQRAARAQGMLHRLYCGESVGDVMQLAQEIASIRQGLQLLRAGDDRQRLVDRIAERPPEAAATVQ
jgi:hypothetical protein